MNYPDFASLAAYVKMKHMWLFEEKMVMEVTKLKQ